MLEKDIESKVCEYAKKAGWLVYKWTSPNQRGVPDRILFKDGMALAIEFKKAGGKLTALQASVIDSLREQKIAAYVIDNVADGIDMIDYFTLALADHPTEVIEPNEPQPEETQRIILPRSRPITRN